MAEKRESKTGKAATTTTTTTTRKTTKTTTPPINYQPLHLSPILQVGYPGTFLLPFQSSLLENDIIVGTMPTEQNNPEVYNNLMAVTEFLRQHALAVAAESSTGSVSTQRSNITDISTTLPVIAATFYMPTVKDFEITQLDRQAAGLLTTKETTTGLATLVNGHIAALKAAIEHSSGNVDIYDDGSEIGNGFGLSKNLLCSLHSLLCPSDAQAGKFRITQAKAGNTLFCPVVKIGTEMENLFTLMESLWLSWLHEKSNQNSCSTTLLKETYHAVSLAAILMYSINNIHPFANGNGRIARICANYALRRTTGLPFTLTLVATQVHRQEYIEGLKKGHRTLQQLSKDKNSTQSSSSSSTQAVSTFEPIIRMLLDRMAHAIHQFQQLLDERARAATADEESRIARVVRERAASGQCMICLDEKPNITTLCCGQAVHLNCIAEWLANQTTCINCRGPLPQLVHPKAPAEAAARGEFIIEITTTTTGSTDEYDATTSYSSSSTTSTPERSSDSTDDTTTTTINDQNNQPWCISM